MDSKNDDSTGNKNNNEDHRLMTYLRRPYDPAYTDMLTICTSWVHTVHRAAQAYLHQMTSTPSASNITEQDILYAFIWHLLTRAQLHGSSSSGSSNHDSFVPNDNLVEVVKLITIVDVRGAPSPPTHTQSQNQLHPDYHLPAIATVPLHQFLRPVITDETGIPHLRQYALLALAIRSAVEVVQAQGQAQAGQEDARRVKMAAKRDSNEGCGRPLCIFSLDQARREAWKGIGYGESHGRRMATVEIGSRKMTSSSREDEMEMGLWVHTVYKPSTSASADYYAIVFPTTEATQGGMGDGKWRVQLHLHPLARQWLRRWMNEKPEEAGIEPRIRGNQGSIVINANFNIPRNGSTRPEETAPKVSYLRYVFK
ncbi:uncharacterized protein B0T23DRAFT_327069 [Neurospora hispaniola]|uniref:Uncharacterized protein n=1 Tax=Neurospora hispaniola TaxID=588809 RepID=A0AAJ0MMD6_9PEZI|nr:hypothetical protein B0T23DRAFT_327069 [Neurospora hispaniola]